MLPPTTDERASAPTHQPQAETSPAQLQHAAVVSPPALDEGSASLGLAGDFAGVPPTALLASPNVLTAAPAVGRAAQTMPAGGATRPATVTDRREFEADARRFVRGAVDFLQASGQVYGIPNGVQKLDGARLRNLLTHWRGAYVKSSGIIRDTLNNDQALAQSLKQAYRGSVQALIGVAAQHLNRTRHQLLQDYADVIHDDGWWRGVPDNAANELVDALPQAERNRIRIITTGITFQNLENYFHPRALAIALPQRVGVRFASGVPRALQQGLTNLAGALTTQMHALEVNSQLTLALDLVPINRDYAAYRFTYVEHPTQQAGAPPTRDILIERVGTIGAEGLPPAQAAAAQTRFTSHAFKRGASFASDAQFQSVLGALTQLPDAMLNPINGITFARAARSVQHPTWAGEYDSDAHTITLFDSAFTTSLTRFGQPGQNEQGAGVSDGTAQTIMHEIGHAVDLASIRRTSGALQTFLEQHGRLLGDNRFWLKGEDLRRSRQLRQQMLAARTFSGAQISPRTGQVVDGATQSDFRRAAASDGGQRITAYSNEGWREFFAESFSLYMTAPDDLHRLRPNVFAFFVANFPK